MLTLCNMLRCVTHECLPADADVGQNMHADNYFVIDTDQQAVK